MSEIEHPSLENFIHGRLSDEEVEAVIKHLVLCEACEHEAERLWETASFGRSLHEVALPTPGDSEANARSLFRRIHRSDLGGQLVRLYTQGFLGLLTTLLHPVVPTIRRPKSAGG